MQWTVGLVPLCWRGGAGEGLVDPSVGVGVGSEVAVSVYVLSLDLWLFNALVENGRR